MAESSSCLLETPLLKWRDEDKDVNYSFRPLDDGHTPEGMPANQRKAQYVAYTADTAEAAPAVYVTDHAVPPHICQAWYESMTAVASETPATAKVTETETAHAQALPQSSSPQPPPAWGTYVTLEQVYECWRRPANDHTHVPNTQENAQNKDKSQSNRNNLPDRHALAVEVAAVLLRQVWQLQRDSNNNDDNDDDDGRAGGVPAPNISYTLRKEDGTIQETKKCDACDKESCKETPTQPTVPVMPTWWRKRRVHGIAVWALASSEGAAVPYHIDYAEQVRYAHNILVTPLWGGILHCSPLQQQQQQQQQQPQAQESGDNDTGINMEGGDYFAYLGNRDECLEHYQRHGYKAHRQPGLPQTQCIQIPYRTNRLISQAGYLPHGSTAVRQLSSAEHTKARRVVVGLNVFGEDVAALANAYPEHSPQFNAWVKSLRKSRCRNKQISVQSLVRKHPQTARALLKFKRQGAFQEAVRKLQNDVQEILVRAGAQGMSLYDIQAQCSNPNQQDGLYPSSTDVQVFIQQQCRKGKLCLVKGTLECTDAVIRLPSGI